MAESQSLADALPKEIQRCQDLLVIYSSIGPAGIFASTMIKQDLDKAIKAMANGDLPKMIMAYEALKGYKT